MQLWFFPVDNGTVICAYRVDLLEECGYTIDDMTDKGINYNKKKNKTKQANIYFSWVGMGNDLVYMMLQAEGESQFKDGKPYITENEKLVKIVEIIGEMINRNVLYLANDWSDYTDQTIIGDMLSWCREW